MSKWFELNSHVSVGCFATKEMMKGHWRVWVTTNAITHLGFIIVRIIVIWLHSLRRDIKRIYKAQKKLYVVAKIFAAT